MFGIPRETITALVACAFAGLGAFLGIAAAALLWLFGVSGVALVGVPAIATLAGALAGLRVG